MVSRGHSYDSMYRKRTALLSKLVNIAALVLFKISLGFETQDELKRKLFNQVLFHAVSLFNVWSQNVFPYLSCLQSENQNQSR